MPNKNKLLLAASAVTILGGSILGSRQAFAQTTTSNQSPMSSLVKKIADKFGLNQSEVQAVFDQSRQEMETKRRAEYETRLSQLVSDGKLTEAQKQLIIAKQAELAANRKASFTNIHGKSAAERKAAMEAERTALQEWATKNGIDLKYLMFGWDRIHGGPRFRKGKAPTDDAVASPAP